MGEDRRHGARAEKAFGRNAFFLAAATAEQTFAHLLDPDCEYVVQDDWTEYTEFLEEGCDAALFVAMHAKAGTPDGVMAHTVSGQAWRELKFNGRSVGETGINAALCGQWNCPVLLVTGDEAVCREARELLGDGLTTVAVKKGLGSYSARQFPAASVPSARYSDCQVMASRAEPLGPAFGSNRKRYGSRPAGRSISTLTALSAVTSTETGGLAPPFSRTAYVPRLPSARVALTVRPPTLPSRTTPGSATTLASRGAPKSTIWTANDGASRFS